MDTTYTDTSRAGTSHTYRYPDERLKEGSAGAKLIQISDLRANFLQLKNEAH